MSSVVFVTCVVTLASLPVSCGVGCCRSGTRQRHRRRVKPSWTLHAAITRHSLVSCHL